MAALSPGDIASPIRWILRRQSNVEVLLADVRAIDRARQRLILADGELTYDYLIVASGATHAYFGHDEWRANAPWLKTLEDALDIRRRVLLAFERAEREDAECGRPTYRHRRRPTGVGPRARRIPGPRRDFRPSIPAPRDHPAGGG
jgi:NADH dehydrogenase FAD-containing subunit